MHEERWALGANAEVGERQVNCLGNKWEWGRAGRWSSLQGDLKARIDGICK